jgi:hypothetical protein
MVERYDIGDGSTGARIDAPGGNSVYVENYGDRQSITWPSRLDPQEFTRIGEQQLDLGSHKGEVDVYRAGKDDQPLRTTVDGLTKLTRSEVKGIHVVRVDHRERNLTLVWQHPIEDPSRIEVAIIGDVPRSPDTLQRLIGATAVTEVRSSVSKIVNSVIKAL